MFGTFEGKIEMKVTPKTEAQIAEASLIEDGEYVYSVIGAVEQVSKAGNEMTKQSVQIFDNEGEPATRIWDYLIDTDATAYKVRHFADSAGLLGEYESGNLPAEIMLGATGRCKVGTQAAQNGYPAKNVIRDYCKRVVTDKPVAVPKGGKKKRDAVDDDMDQDIPF